VSFPRPATGEYLIVTPIPGYVEAELFLWDNLEKTKGYIFSYDGWEWCATVEGGPVYGDLNKDPLEFSKDGKINVNVYSLHSAAGGSNIIIGPSDSKVGQLWSIGAGVGLCAINESWNVKRLAASNLENRPDTLLNYDYEPSEGTAAADFFTFNDSLMYGENHAPIIKDFNKDDGDRIAFNGSVKDEITSREDMNFKVVNSKKQLKEASEQDYDFIYFQKEGFLYHDKSPKIGGFGDGGLLAILEGSPEMDSSSLYLHL